MKLRFFLILRQNYSHFDDDIASSQYLDVDFERFSSFKDKFLMLRFKFRLFYYFVELKANSFFDQFSFAHSCLKLKATRIAKCKKKSIEKKKQRKRAKHRSSRQQYWVNVLKLRERIEIENLMNWEKLN